MNLIILGPQGSGKGTQAELLVKIKNFNYFEAGSFLRKLSENDSKLKQDLDKGVLIDDLVMFNLVKEFISGKNIYNNWLFDGYPRSVKQYELLKNFFLERSQKIDLAIVLTISEKETLRRLSARRMDINTKKIYNLITNPPGPDVDPKNLIQRDDDKEDAILNRLKNYNNLTKPLIELFRKEAILKEIDGEKSIDEIHNEILSVIEKNDK